MLRINRENTPSFSSHYQKNKGYLPFVQEIFIHVQYIIHRKLYEEENPCLTKLTKTII